eukprot:2211627-Alexandrium_andersonii.AAC.1
MSASLVGSEMCIRDRFRALRRCGVMACLRVLIEWRGWVGMDVVEHCTVSYTHLTLPTICSV